MERTELPKLRNGSKGGFEPGLSQLRVRCSTAELPRSEVMMWMLLVPGYVVHFIRKENVCDT